MKSAQPCLLFPNEHCRPKRLFHPAGVGVSFSHGGGAFRQCHQFPCRWHGRDAAGRRVRRPVDPARGKGPCAWPRGDGIAGAIHPPESRDELRIAGGRPDWRAVKGGQHPGHAGARTKSPACRQDLQPVRLRGHDTDGPAGCGLVDDGPAPDEKETVAGPVERLYGGAVGCASFAHGRT